MGTMIKNTKVLMLDLDGTVYLDGELIGDVKNTLQYMRDKGIQIVYLTNNSSCTNKAYYDKLSKLGILGENDIVYSSLDGAKDYLTRNYRDKTIYPVATREVVEYLKNNGIQVSDSADIVLLTFDKELNYEKIVNANRLIVKNAIYICTHPDATCPAKDVFIPDAGSFIEMFKKSSGRVPDIIIGKPYSVMAEILMEKLGVSASEVTMVGDRLHTDIAFGVNNGFNTALVLSGESTLQTLQESETKPNIVIEDINVLKNII